MTNVSKCIHSFKKNKNKKPFHFFYLHISISFIFYIPPKKFKRTFFLKKMGADLQKIVDTSEESNYSYKTVTKKYRNNMYFFLDTWK